MSSRIQAILGRHGSKALISYITCGDPDIITTVELMNALVEGGADIIELGVPFTDPMADGAVIQRAVQRALANQVSLTDVLRVVERFRENNTYTPVILMGYLNPIYRMGYRQFAYNAWKAGVDGVLVVDCPVEYAQELQTQVEESNMHMIYLVTPTTTKERMQLIAEQASGFVYYVSLKGVTGAGSLDVADVERHVEEVRKVFDIPIAVGFGIKDEQSASQISKYADAIVVGSHFVDLIEKNYKDPRPALTINARRIKQAIS